MTSQSMSRAPVGWPGPAPVRTLVSALALVLSLACLTACGDDRDPDAAPSPSGTSETPSDSPSPSEPSATSDPSVQPATGPVLEVSFARVNAPEDFHKALESPLGVTAHDTDTESAMSLGQQPMDSSGSLRDLARNWISLGGYMREPKILAPVVLDGVEVYHISGATGPAFHLDGYGAVFRGEFVNLEIQLQSSIPAAERKEIVESVLASFGWL